MIDLIVDGLPEFVSPGDIVGAFANEAKIDGSKIGKIRINRKRKRALVEVEESAVQAVLDTMNERQISGVTVQIKVKDHNEFKKATIRNYTTNFKNLLYMERQDELVKNRLEMRHLSGEERQHLGHAILDIRGRATGFPQNDYYRVRFFLQQSEAPLPEHQFSVGDLVIISKEEPLEEGSPQGRITQIEPMSITVEFKGEPPYYVYGRGLRMDLYGKDERFQQSLQILKQLYFDDESLPVRLVDILLGEEEPEWAEKPILARAAYHLDREQKEALSRSLETRDLLLIQGGAGTGKTAVGIEIIRQHLQAGKTVLAVGTSLMARDALAEKMVQSGVRVLKLGDVDVKDEPEYDQIYKILLEIRELSKRRDELTHPGGQWMDGLTYKDVMERAKIGGRYAGVPGYRLKEMAEWITLQRDIDRLVETMRHYQNKIWTRLLEEHDLLCITHEEAAHLNQLFDLVVVDDANLVHEPEILPAYFSGKKVILLGDSTQAPPPVVNDQARAGGLGRSLFTRLLEELDDEWICTLKTQHRFSHSIWDCLREVCPVGEKRRIGMKNPTFALNKWRTGPVAEILEGDPSLVFVDTSRMADFEEMANTQFVNEMEADLIREFIQLGLDFASMEDRVAVLTFYDEQVKMIKKEMEYSGLPFDRVHRVDEFCGLEKDMIFVSLVHSNPTGYLGQVGSIPHLITAITRAKEKCIIIGNKETLGAHPFYEKLLTEIAEKGCVYTL